MKTGIVSLVITLLAACSSGTSKTPEDKLYEKVLASQNTHKINFQSQVFIKYLTIFRRVKGDG